MKTALVRINAGWLGDVLGLPEGSHIDAISQDGDDLCHGSFTIRIRGAGEETQEGSHFRYMLLDELGAKQ